MAVKKFVNYTSIINPDTTLNTNYNLQLNVLDNSGNYLIYKDILRHQISQRQNSASTKTRSEVRGGGRKPWRQKGTGRARAGSNRSPLWKGGGVIFGPKPKKTKFKLNKKERKLALQTLLYNKRKGFFIIDNLESLLIKPKTKTICQTFKKYKLDLTKKILIIVDEKTHVLNLSLRNLQNIELISSRNLNTLSLLKAKQIILTLPALNRMKEIYEQ